MLELIVDRLERVAALGRSVREIERCLARAPIDLKSLWDASNGCLEATADAGYDDLQDLVEAMRRVVWNLGALDRWPNGQEIAYALRLFPEVRAAIIGKAG